MDKYERVGREYAKKHGHQVFPSNKGNLYLYEENGINDWTDEPDDIFDSWKEYTKHFIGNDLRRLRKFKHKKHLRKK